MGVFQQPVSSYPLRLTPSRTSAQVLKRCPEYILADNFFLTGRDKYVEVINKSIEYLRILKELT